jgi:hypothetical protein
VQASRLRLKFREADLASVPTNSCSEAGALLVYAMARHQPQLSFWTLLLSDLLTAIVMIVALWGWERYSTEGVRAVKAPLTEALNINGVCLDVGPL